MSDKSPNFRYATPPPLPPSKPKEPKKRNKLHALWLKLNINSEKKKRGGVRGETASSLLFAAHSLNDDISHATRQAQVLKRDSLTTPRPGTPPARDPLFQRPTGAPLSEYEKSANAYNAIVSRYQGLNDTMRLLQQRFPTFQDNVRKLKAEHPPWKKVGKYEHDVDSLDNAVRNMDKAMTLLVETLGEARTAAM